VWARAGKGWGGVVVVWGDGGATRRGKVDGRDRACEECREEKERGAERAGLGGSGGGGQGCAGGHAWYVADFFPPIL